MARYLEHTEGFQIIQFGAAFRKAVGTPAQQKVIAAFRLKFRDIGCSQSDADWLMANVCSDVFQERRSASLDVRTGKPLDTIRETALIARHQLEQQVRADNAAA